MHAEGGRVARRGSQTMQAMVYTRPGVVEMLDVERPAVGEDEVVVTVESVGICGSELHGIGQPGFREPPLVMGHEFAGVTEDGRRVTVNPIVWCGSCDRCVAGQDHLCRTRSIIGIHRPGAFTREVVVPERNLHVLPDELTFEQAALIEPLANGLHAWKVAGAPEGARVGIIGAGTIGLVCSMAAARGTDDITIVDLDETRLGLAGKLVNAATGTQLEGEFDVIIDAVGGPSTHAASLDHLRPGGTTVWIGLLSAEAGFDAKGLVRGEKVVRGTFAYPNAEFAAAVSVAREVNLDWSTSFPLSEGATIFTELMNGRSDVIKAVLRP